MKPMVYGSICSGIEAATAAWEPLGWRAAWFAEIEPFPCAVLSHHYPGVPNLGDISAEDFADRASALGRLDVLVGGTPCQSFSVAGKRESLADDRGSLALVFCRLVERLDPWCVLWENVPGVLSTSDNAFGCFLAGLVGAAAPLVPGDPAGRWPDAGLVRGPRRSAAWGILDAQHFGLAQRRRRVFVASLRADDWRCPAAILFEPHGLPGNPAPGGEEEPGIAPCVTPGNRRASGNRSGEQLTVAYQANGSGSFRAGAISTAASDDNGSNHVVISPPLTTRPWSDRDCQHDRLVADTLKAHHGRCREDDTYIPEIAHSLRTEGFDASEDGTGRGTPLISVAFNPQAGGTQTTLGFDPGSTTVGTLGCSQTPAVSFVVNAAESCATRDHARESDVARCLDQTGGFASSQGGTVVAQGFTELGKGHVTYQATEKAASLRTTSGGGGTMANLVADMAVRRLMPVECERLQGFADGYTDVPFNGKPAADGPRYRAIGNSMAVTKIRWIGRRMAWLHMQTEGA